MADVILLNSIQVQDYLGVPSSHDIFLKMPDTTTLAQVITKMQAYQTLFDAVTGGQQMANTVRVFVPFTGGLKASPVAGDETEKTGLFNFSQFGTRYKNGINVPAIRETLITSGKIDLSAGAITAWVTWLLDTATGYTVVTKLGAAILALLDALISFRKHRKAESRRSFETP